MRSLKLTLLIAFSVSLFFSCNNETVKKSNTDNIRPLKDTVGFAQYSWQMDSLMSRIDRIGWKMTEGAPWKMAICPHDDYTYVGSLYPEVLHNIKARKVIVLGVAHRASALGLADSLIFDSHTHWKGPWGNVKVAEERDELFTMLSNIVAQVSDKMFRTEHSLESLIPFLQYFNRDVEIIPILVPTMHPDRMKETGFELAEAIKKLAETNDWEWGTDYAILVTTDAVHYGDEDWGGKNYARFGCDDQGNEMARKFESEIISETLQGIISPEKAVKFSDYTLNSEDHSEYIWTWCGRYCIPVTLYTTYYLNDKQAINGELIGYTTSITADHIPVDDIGLGTTAVATDNHWVGYAALGYR